MFFWFAVMAVLLYLLSRNQPVEIVMLVAMGVVGAIRTCSYYKEALATDIAKILPFALLGITLIDSSIIRIIDSTEGVREAVLRWETAIYYLVAVVALELILRMVTGIFGFIRGRRKSHKLKKEASAPEPQMETSRPRNRAWGPVPEPRPVGLGVGRSNGGYSLARDELQTRLYGWWTGWAREFSRRVARIECGFSDRRHGNARGNRLGAQQEAGVRESSLTASASVRSNPGA